MFPSIVKRAAAAVILGSAVVSAGITVDLDDACVYTFFCGRDHKLI